LSFLGHFSISERKIPTLRWCQLALEEAKEEGREINSELNEIIRKVGFVGCQINKVIE